MLMTCKMLLTAIASSALALGAAGKVDAQTGSASGPPISLAVDATDTDHAIFTVHETIPATPGPLTLLYPQWEAASHAPTVPIQALAGLVATADGRRIAWRRDPRKVHAFHLAIPPGATSVTLDFQILSDADTLREAQVNVQWQRLLLYPAGSDVARIQVAARLTLPKGMHAYGALRRAGEDAGAIRFAPVALERLVDAPVWGAKVSRIIPLTPGAAQPITVALLADDPADLAPADAAAGPLRALIVQAGKIFGAPPFTRYDMLVSLTDRLGTGGVEHREEGENDLPANYLREPGKQLNSVDLIAHEYVHAWNGRYRIPADLLAPDYNTPVSDSLLWVYEGQTEFWGRVLAARAGLRDRQQTLDRLALDAALVATRKGRAWKSLADSVNDPVYMAGHHVDWRDWTRREDYYAEGVLLWLDVDARLRELTRGARGLDAFAADFFHVDAPGAPARAYDLEAVCAALARVAPADWHGFLARHLDSHETQDAMAGLARAGWRLVFTPEATDTFRQNETDDGARDYSFSVGLKVDEGGRVRAVSWEGPAFLAGLAPGGRITRVDGLPYSAAALEHAVANTVTTPLDLVVDDGTRSRTVRLAYRGGARYPHLERIPDRADRLDALLTGR
ncbi:peptidase M61 [Sphingomonas morindae]|uniref:Peptidase M61 n=1 Tax=Sphingomonas morindae TaxID=1541170 RepID=A0ABY4XCT7_9SPHN|nr:peptidase M61 [Sphingomonas morindae]USI74654.1 peptidase M61 [Sphingomonas morindae]